MNEKVIDDNELIKFRDTVSSILPYKTIVDIIRISDCSEGLMKDELPYIKNAVDKRKLEFTAGRVSARRALAHLGIKPAPLHVGSKREPIWPDGIVGSITHDGDYCIVAVQYEEVLTGLGIDITENHPLEENLIDMICTRSEADYLYDMPIDMFDEDPYKIIFSIKESVYKCFFPRVKQIFDFKDVSVSFDGSGKNVGINLLNKELFTGLDVELKGCYCSLEGYIFSAIWTE